MQDAAVNRFFLVLLAAALGAADNAHAGGTAPVVVELFTSQGCSSCPPADKYLGELAKRPDILPLAFHVEYWNYIGWTDPYSKPWATRRQRDYQSSLKERFVYTPQMVVEGGAEGVGSERDAIEVLISAAESHAVPHPDAQLRWRQDGALLADIGEGPSPVGQPATVWLVGFDRMHTMKVMAGENEGHTAWDYQAVRSFRRLGGWAGFSEELVVPADEAKSLGDYGAAVLIQAGGNGPILTAARIDMPQQ
jgi:hypothetical protein